MKKFIFMVLAVSAFFVGIGGVIDKAGAKFKSDERALEIIAQARQAIGGDAAIKNVRSLTISGNAAQTFTVDGAARVEQGTLEINLQMPNQFNRIMKLGNSADGEIRQERKVIVMTTTKDVDKATVNTNENGKTKVFVLKKDDANNAVFESGDAANGKVFINKDVTVNAGGVRQNELFRTAFALLLSAPENTDASYSYAGVETVDGRACDVVAVSGAATSPFKLYIDQSSHLPAMVAYQGIMPMMFKFNKEDLAKNGDEATKNVIITRDGSPVDAAGSGVQVFTRRLDAVPTSGEFQIKFSDFRSTDGVQLPYKWTQTVNGQPDQIVDITSYNVNPPNIAEKFQNEKIMIRTVKPQQ